jgi:hypothetical protein
MNLTKRKQWQLATVTFDDDGKKAYANVKRSDDVLGINQSGLVIVNGWARAFKVKQIEQSHDDNIFYSLELQNNQGYLVLSDKKSETAIIRTVAENTPTVYPYLSISLTPSSLTADEFVKLKASISRSGGLTLGQTIQSLTIDSTENLSNSITWNAGLVAASCATFFANNIKASLFQKKGKSYIDLVASNESGKIIDGAANMSTTLLREWLREMRSDIQDQPIDSEKYSVYNLSLILTNSHEREMELIISNEQVKNVSRIKNKDSKKRIFRLEIDIDAFTYSPDLPLVFNLIIERSTVTKSDYEKWTGKLYDKPPIYDILNYPKQHVTVESFQYWNPNGVYEPALVLKEFPSWQVLSIGGTQSVLLTNSSGHIAYGLLKTTNDDKILFTKSPGYTKLKWASKIENFKNGELVRIRTHRRPGDLFSGLIPSSQLGLKINVDFASLDAALQVFKELQDKEYVNVENLESIKGNKVTSADLVASQGTSNYLTAALSDEMRTGTDRWFNAEKKVRLTVTNDDSNNIEIYSNNNGNHRQFEQRIADFLPRAAREIGDGYHNALGSSIIPQSTEWFFGDSKIKKITTKEYSTKKMYDIYVDEAFPQYTMSDNPFILFTRIEKASVNEDLTYIQISNIAALDEIGGSFGVWNLKGDTTIGSNSELTIEKGQQLRLNNYTLINKGTIIIQQGDQRTSSGALILNNSDIGKISLTNDGKIDSTGVISLLSSAQNNGTINNNRGSTIDVISATFVNNGNGKINNEGRFSLTKNASFVGSGKFIGNDIVSY